jgi:hypothetical protein
VLQGDEVRKLVLVLMLIFLPGCAGGSTAPERERLSAACEAFDQYKQVGYRDQRKEFLATAGMEFRAAAFLANSAKYEVLAEYTEAYVNLLGGLEEKSRIAIEKFCQDLK